MILNFLLFMAKTAGDLGLYLSYETRSVYILVLKSIYLHHSEWQCLCLLFLCVALFVIACLPGLVRDLKSSRKEPCEIHVCGEIYCFFRLILLQIILCHFHYKFLSGFLELWIKKSHYP